MSYNTCRDMDLWAQRCREWSAAKRKGLDFETGPDQRFNHKNNALRCEDGARIVGIAIAWIDDSGNMKSAYGPIRHWFYTSGGPQLNPKKALMALSDAIRDQPEDALVVVHNIQMEAAFMLSEGVVWPLEGQFHDLMVAARVLNMGVGFRELIGLKPLQKEYLGRDLSTKTEMDVWLRGHGFKAGQDIWRCPVAIASPYAQDDARDCLEIWLKWEKAVYRKPTKWWWSRKADRQYRFDLYELEIETAIQACLCALRGNRVDVKMCDRRGKAAEALKAMCNRWIRHYLGLPTINPGSPVQMRGILFSERFALEASTAHLTDSFQKLSARDQSLIIAGRSEKSVEDYASLNIDALKFYEEQSPEHADLFFMMAVARKAVEALKWFVKNAHDYVSMTPDPWWGNEDFATQWLQIIFHRLKTVGTVSGRMAAGDFNAQAVPKRFKMLFDVERLCDILRAFLPAAQFRELVDMMDVSEAAEGDEAKFLGIEPGEPVFDFSARAMFIPRPGRNHRAWDLSQVEMRLFGHYSGNRLLCEGYGKPMSDELMTRELHVIREVALGGASMVHAFRNTDVRRHARGDMSADAFDIHQFVASELGIRRKPAKAINFGIVYGMGQKKITRSLGFSLAEGKAYLARYHARFPEIQITQAMIKSALRNRGYIFDEAGRRYYLPIQKAYIGLNRLIQGFAAVVFKMGFVRTCQLFTGDALGGSGVHPITRRRHMDGALVNTCIHDEMLCEVPKAVDHRLTDFAVRSSMTLVHGLKVPLGTSSEASPKSWDDCSDFTNDDFCGVAV
jgi:DNA polymerase I-like protein with 3'-5' exonuclease and polymerase domains